MTSAPDTNVDAVALAARIRSGAVSAADTCERALHAAADAPAIVWSLDADRARADAARIDAAVAAARTSSDTEAPLAGVPVLVKDSFDVTGLPTSAGLPAPLHTATRDAPAVARLRAAGAVVIGKTAMDQLAWTMTGQAPGFPTLENPAAPGHLTGGSSGGSAAAVAAGIVPLAFGSDTAGSVRVPAAWCGVVGVKPSRDAIDLTGVVPLAPSIDTIGVIARTTGDCTIALAALGLDVRGEPHDGPVRCTVLGDTPAWFQGAIAPLFAASGWTRARELDALPRARVGRILAAEAAACWPQTPAGATEELSAGLERGRGFDAHDIDADRAALAETIAAAPTQILGGDETRLLLTPTVSGPAPAVDGETSVAAASRFTLTFGALGWPSASLPCGLIDGRPVGLQLAAAPGDDAFLLTCLAAAETILDPGRDLA